MVLHPGEVDDLLHELGEPLRLALHAGAEPAHRLGVIGEVGDRLGEQGDRPDRGLELVRHVRHEVPAHRIEAARLGLVVAQDEDERRAQGCYPGVEVAGDAGVRAALLLEVELLDEPAHARPAHDREEFRGSELVAADEAVGVGRR